MSVVITIPLDVAVRYMPAEAIADAVSQWRQVAEEAVLALQELSHEYGTLSRSQDRQALTETRWALVEAMRHNAHTNGAMAVAVNTAAARVAAILSVTR
jgi:hypothetical protein